MTGKNKSRRWESNFTRSKFRNSCKNFEYQKDVDILYAEFGYALVNSKQLKIKFDEIKYDQKNQL